MLKLPPLPRKYEFNLKTMKYPFKIILVIFQRKTFFYWIINIIIYSRYLIFYLFTKYFTHKVIVEKFEFAPFIYTTNYKNQLFEFINI